MCGILNIISKKNKLDVHACQRALAKLSWRGPDQTTFEVIDGHIFLGQTILSVTGVLPQKTGRHLVSRSGRYLLSYNGEIYNYKELSEQYLTTLGECIVSATDSEILVNLYDSIEDASVIPKKLDGMYAYSIFDKHARTLSVTRDPQGEKTVYYFEDEAIIIFSTEIEPILYLRSDLSLDLDVMQDCFNTRHFMFFDRTIYHGIRQVLPGQMIQVNAEDNSVRKTQLQSVFDWVSEDSMRTLGQSTMGELEEQLDFLFKTIVKEMVPQRKFASVVSGGVDSSLISYYLSQEKSPEVLVAVDHVGKDEISNNLLGFEKVLGQPIHVVKINKLDYAAEIERAQKVCGSPLLAHSFIGQSLQAKYVSAMGCKVMFGGEGADELYGGYDCYLEKHNLDTVYCPSKYSIYTPVQLNEADNSNSRMRWDLAGAWRNSLAAYECLTNSSEKISQATMLCDFAYQLSAVGLRGTDMMSMMWGVESRSIFIRKPLAQLMLNAPLCAKINPKAEDPLLRTKPLLKKLFLKYYPRDLLVKKQGFSGFPNESLSYLGAVESFETISKLNVSSKNLGEILNSRALSWKLINMEYFLRARSEHKNVSARVTQDCLT